MYYRLVLESSSRHPGIQPQGRDTARDNDAQDISQLNEAIFYNVFHTPHLFVPSTMVPTLSYAHRQVCSIHALGKPGQEQVQMAFTGHCVCTMQ